MPHQPVVLPQSEETQIRDLKDLIAYQKRRDLERKVALNRIARDAFESGLYDRTGIPEGGEDE